MHPVEVPSLSPKLHWLCDQHSRERGGQLIFQTKRYQMCDLVKKNFFLATAGALLSGARDGGGGRSSGLKTPDKCVVIKHNH